MDSEWSIKKWPAVNDLAICHNLCSKGEVYTYGLAIWGVCYRCNKVIPDHIKLQWNLIQKNHWYYVLEATNKDSLIGKPIEI